MRLSFVLDPKAADDMLCPLFVGITYLVKICWLSMYPFMLEEKTAYVLLEVTRLVFKQVGPVSTRLLRVVGHHVVTNNKYAFGHIMD